MSAGGLRRLDLDHMLRGQVRKQLLVSTLLWLCFSGCPQPQTLNAQIYLCGNPEALCKNQKP